MSLNNDIELYDLMKDKNNPELFTLLCTADVEIRYKAAVILSNNADIDIIKQVVEFSKDKNNIKREMAAHILGNIKSNDVNYYIDAIQVLINMLKHDKSPKVRANAATSFNHIKYLVDHCLSDEVNTDKILDILNTCAHDALLLSVYDKSPIVRESVAFTLGSIGDEKSISALAVLTEDTNKDVRDWATFGLANLDIDTPIVRASLIKRLEDSNKDIRIYAIWGLAKFRDSGVYDLINNELSKRSIVLEIFEAAGHLKDKRLLPKLIRLSNKFGDASPAELIEAIKELKEATHRE